jgi:hypothetical protein
LLLQSHGLVMLQHLQLSRAVLCLSASLDSVAWDQRTMGLLQQAVTACCHSTECMPILCTA